jgi:hypothetical protein
MTSLQERIGNERRRLRNVRLNMLAAIEQKSGGDEAYVPFHIASADYIDATMQRVHEQDVKMGQMIREKADVMDENIEQALAELNDRLQGARQHLKPFLAARDALREKGRDALEAFEKEGKIYSDFIVANMGHHPSTADLGAKLFSPEDWEYMAGTTDEEIQREEAFFEKVQAAIPDSLTNVTQVQLVT